jgi:hypothetical protein
MDKYYVLTFQNTHGAISAESVLKEKNIRIEIMPTPTGITKSCGISIKFSEEYMEKIKGLVKDESINIKNAYVKEGSNYKVFEI